MKTEVLAKFDDDNDPGGVTRRRLFMGLGAGAMAATASGGTVVFMQYLEPNVLFEPPTKHVVGIPDDYPVTSVMTHASIRLYVVRMPRGFFAMSNICTHLGCITQWSEHDGMVECPCHGSEYAMNGRVIRGPAVRPLPHFALSLEKDGQLVVDTSIIADPDFFLRV